MTTCPPKLPNPPPSALPGWDDDLDEFHSPPPAKEPDPTFVWEYDPETGETNRIIQKDAVVSVATVVVTNIRIAKP